MNQSPHGRALDDDAAFTPQSRDELIERHIRFAFDLAAHPVMGTGQFAMASTALRFRLKRSCLPLQLDHVIHELDRNTEMRCRAAVRVAFLHKINNPRAQFHWMGFAHICLPVLLTSTESQISQLGNPESDQPEHALGSGFITRT